MPKIYTKTGDKGMTGTFRGRMSKSDQLAIALGSIDELNSWIGMCRSRNDDKELKRIQTNLLTIGSILAGSEVQTFNGVETRRLEKLIDKLTGELPKLANFIYPMGGLQVARSVARRAEREVVKLEFVDKNILKYLNRLSDALFTLGRWENYRLGLEEEVWLS